MRYVIGNLVQEVKRGIIIQQVNAQGVMGSGIAKEIREKWPRVWDEYSKVVRPHTIDMGAAYLGMVIPVEVEEDLWVMNVVGQQFYGRDKNVCYTSYDALDKGFKRVKEIDQMIRENRDIALPIHLPKIGCGLGGGKWNVVSALIDNHFQWMEEEPTCWQLEADAT